jgi:hypothetical protein
MTLGSEGTITIGNIDSSAEEIIKTEGKKFGFNIDNTGRMTS